MALRFNTAYHPQSNDQTKVINKCLETYLRYFANKKPKKWGQYLSWAEYSYNTSFHTATQTTPFRIVYDQDPPSLLTYEARSSVFMEVDQQLVEQDAMLSELRQHLHQAQQRMKAQADTKRRDIAFEVGDPILLKLRPYRQ